MLTVTTGASSAAVAPGVNTLIFITATGAYHIKFGVAGIAAASASDLYIPANAVPDAWEFTDQCTSFRVFNPGGSTIYVYYMQIGKR